MDDGTRDDSGRRTDEEQDSSLRTVFLGLIVLALGVLWLLDISDILDVTWTVIGSIMLVLVGIAMIATARQGSHGGLVFLGLVLTVVVLAGSIFSWSSFDQAVGDQTVRPTSFENVQEEYTLGVGDQTVDLAEVEFPSGETKIEIQQGLGNLEIRLPSDIGYRIDWQIGAGNIDSITQDQSGPGLNGTDEIEGYEEYDVRLSLDIRLGLGAIEVRQ